VKPTAGGVVGLAGRLVAELVQSCVVSLAPVPAAIDEEIEARFIADHPVDRRHTAEDIELEEDDPPEVAPGGRIDLGELTVAQLALVLDPYPRAPGVHFDAAEWGEAPSGKGSSPFAALAGLKKTKQS